MNANVVDPPLELAMRRVERRAGVAAVAAFALLALGGAFNPAAFFPAYLLAWTFSFGTSMGSLVVLMMHYLIGGAWGYVVRRPLEAAAMNLFPMAILFVPILFGLHRLYPWAMPGVAATIPEMREKALYLSTPSFIVRQIIYFAIWLVFAWFMRAWSRDLDRASDPMCAYRLTALSAAGLVVYFITMTFASVDWLMSLEPRWYSTMFPVIVMAGQVLTAIALTTIATMHLAPRRPIRNLFHRSIVNDLGNLLLAFVMFWSYVAFMEYLIIWNANLPEDNNWFYHRSRGGWQWIPLVLLLLHFAVPFCILLSRTAKRNARVIYILSIVLIVAHFVDQFWIVIPSFERQRLSPNWLQLVAPAALGACWIAFFVRRLRCAPLVVQHDPQYESLVKARVQT